MANDRVGLDIFPSRSRALKSSLCVIVLGLMLTCMQVGCSGHVGGSGPGHIIPPKLKATSLDKRALIKVNSIGVAPVRFADNARLEGGEQARLDAVLSTIAVEQLDIDVTPSAKLGVSVKPGTAEEVEFQREVLASANRLKLDAVILTTVSSLDERDASNLSANSAASFGFGMRLVRTTDAALLWQGTYFVHDEAINQNLFKLPENLKGGGAPGWKSLDEYLRSGFSEAVGNIRIERETAFGSR